MRTLLLVEDSAAIAGAVRALLTALPRGPRVVVVKSAEEALVRARLDCPEIAVVDWQLPGMDGIELTRLLRERATGIEIIGTSVDARLAVRRAMLEAGADHFVAKPDLHAELLRRFG